MRTIKNVAVAVLKWSAWLSFAVLFYYSGLSFSEWVMGSQTNEVSWVQGILIGIFPVMLPLFFVVNRRVGCASGACRPRADSNHRAADSPVINRAMPGA